MNTYVVEITKSSQHDWYSNCEGTRFEVYQGAKIYMVKSDYDNRDENDLSVRGIDFKDCEKICVTCGHLKSQHKTTGGFCKHCPCVEFKSRRTWRALDGVKRSVQKGSISGKRSGRSPRQ